MADPEPDSLLESHLDVPNLIRPLLNRLSVETLAELLAIDVQELTSLGGVGQKKLTLVRQLIESANALLGSDSPPSNDQSRESDGPPVSIPGNLTYVPNLLAGGLKSAGVESIDDLLTFDVQGADGLPGWGPRRIALTQALQEFYRLLHSPARPTETASLVTLAPSPLLPDPALAEISISSFVAGESPEGITGVSQLEADNLRSAIQVEYPPPTENDDLSDLGWRDIPLRLGSRIVKVLDDHRIVRIGDLRRFASTGRLPTAACGTGSVASLPNFGSSSLEELRRELQRLDQLGVDSYRLGGLSKPESNEELIERLLSQLDGRLRDLFVGRCQGKTLQELADGLSLTRERCRQLVSKAVRSSEPYKESANELLAPLHQRLRESVFVPVDEAMELVSVDSDWKLTALAKIAGDKRWSVDSGRLTRFSTDDLASLTKIARSVARDRAAGISDPVTIQDAVRRDADLGRLGHEALQRMDPYLDDPWPADANISLLSEGQVATFIRPHLVNAGINGLSLDELRGLGVEGTPDEVEQVLKGEATRLAGDRFRRRGKTYERGDAFVAYLRSSKQPRTAEEITSACDPSIQQPVLVGRYLGPSYEIVCTERGLYSHISHLGLTVDLVKRIAGWSADLLSKETEAVDGELLFDLLADSPYAGLLSNANQIVSIAAKHPDVRRISNNLQVAHQSTFDDAALSLAETDPEIAAEWHPTKNGSVTPADVRPASNKPRWWKCEKGHEFEAQPVYRTRSVRVCPGCQSKWTLEKIRLFVTSLQDHLEALTPAELYTVFQQSGLLDSGGRAKGFVKAAVTGRLPKTEIDKFVAGQPSIVDAYIEGEEVDLEDLEIEENEILQEHQTDHSDEHRDAEAQQDQALPEVKTKAALEAFDSLVFATNDAEAAEFLVESGKAKLWRHAFRNESEAVSEAEAYQASGYSQRVRQEFLDEYRRAKALEIPDGYAFSIGGKTVDPNLMQRHVASQVQQRQRFGNWSGTGAGKTLSAILATRVCRSSLTLVCCPNAVVGDHSSGWTSEIRRVFPDSQVQSKTWSTEWEANAAPRYLVLNFEQLQQPDSEAKVDRFLETHDLDFVIIDEVHYAKQRHAEKASKRKRLLRSLVSEAGRKNPALKVLGLSATPVINNLQEGKSLVEMITDVDQPDLPTKSTVPNCMRMHQQLSMLGTRWRPEYEAGLKIEEIRVDCSHLLGEIEALKSKPSPLDVERILTKARIPSILDAIRRGGPAVVYSHYVTDVDQQLHDAISEAGFRVGYYTGENKEGLDAFKRGEIDVLIGSSSIGTGVDGLQHVCNRLIINSLPWTNAEFEQLIGRVWRQGQESEAVEVVIPVTYAQVGLEPWSYCQSKLDRINYKKSIADAAVDGVVPEGNLRSPAQAQQDILEWLKRLRSGEPDQPLDGP